MPDQRVACPRCARLSAAAAARCSHCDADKVTADPTAVAARDNVAKAQSMTAPGEPATMLLGGAMMSFLLLGSFGWLLGKIFGDHLPQHTTFVLIAVGLLATLAMSLDEALGSRSEGGLLAGIGVSMVLLSAVGAVGVGTVSFIAGHSFTGGGVEIGAAGADDESADDESADDESADDESAYDADAEVCADFNTVQADYVNSQIDDAEASARWGSLASQATDPGLRAALSAFAADFTSGGDPSVAPIRNFCP